ncbi:MAG: flagellar hook capping protein [Epsilonproteobacteria bacterium]|nr:flagellar hook capping protein [Campylobacterota bacterium]
MSTTITSSTDLNSLADSGIAVNPDSQLGKDDFLQLLITELQYQDPTQPTDSEEILNQTSQLAALEAQQNTNKALEELTKSFQQSKDFSAVSAIGKYAKLESTIAITYDEEGKPLPVNFELEFDEDIESGSIQIFDEDYHLVKTIDIEEGSAGKHSFTWDGTNDAGEYVNPGSYNVVANYVNPDGVNLQADFGSHLIESVKFDGSETYVKIDGTFVSFDHVTEIFEPEEEETNE